MVRAGGSYIDYETYFRYPKHIFLGKHVTVNRGCRFYASLHSKEREHITIGNHVAIGPEVCFFAAGHDPDDIWLRDTYGKIKVGNDCWIGGKSIILQGVTINDGVVIGAGSVVTHDIPAWSVAVGIPAKVVRKRNRNAVED